MNSKVKTLKELKDILRRPRGFRVVWVNGCFDIFHAGHVNLLKEAYAFGEVLVVGLNSDKSIQALKGKERPIIKQEYRAAVLAAMSWVDYIVIFDELRPLKELEVVQPDFFVKGSDYSVETINRDERMIVDRYNGEFKFIENLEDISTTWIARKIKYT